MEGKHAHYLFKKQRLLFVLFKNAKVSVTLNTMLQSSEV